jgi:hypothetical protein
MNSGVERVSHAGCCCREELLDLDAIIQEKLQLLQFSTMRDAALKGILDELDVYGREKVFQKVRAWDGPEEERWKMLAVFLDDYAFEYADITGYVGLRICDRCV